MFMLVVRHKMVTVEEYHVSHISVVIVNMLILLVHIHYDWGQLLLLLLLQLLIATVTGQIIP